MDRAESPRPVHTSPLPTMFRTSNVGYALESCASTICERDPGRKRATDIPLSSLRIEKPAIVRHRRIGEWNWVLVVGPAAVDEHSNRDRIAHLRDPELLVVPFRARRGCRKQLSEMIRVEMRDQGVVQSRRARRQLSLHIARNPIARSARRVRMRIVSAIPSPAAPASTNIVVPSGMTMSAELPRPVEIWWMSSVPGVQRGSVDPTAGACAPTDVAIADRDHA